MVCAQCFDEVQVLASDMLPQSLHVVINAIAVLVDGDVHNMVWYWLSPLQKIHHLVLCDIF